MREAVITAAVRTAIGKAPKGTLRSTRPDDMAAQCVMEIMRRSPGLKPDEIDDLALGCAIPEKEQGYNMARQVVLRAGLPDSVPAFTVNRMCSSGLQSITQSAERIMAGGADIVLAGGAESMSLIPFLKGGRLHPNPCLNDENPGAYDWMGVTAENVQRKYGITREEQDAFAYRSHRNALAAIEGGRFHDQVVPLNVRMQYADGNGGPKVFETTFKTDEGPRRDTNLEALAKLRPAFDPTGTVTPGNSSQTSDGAAMVLLMTREKAEALGLPVLASFRGFSVGGVDPALMGIGPIAAIPKVLKRLGLKTDDIKLIELNEAFAVQALAVMKDLGLETDRVNVNGGAIALGHPLGCSAARLTVTLIHELRRQGGGLGLVSMCVGGGMGAAGVFEVFGAN